MSSPLSPTASASSSSSSMPDPGLLAKPSRSPSIFSVPDSDEDNEYDESFKSESGASSSSSPSPPPVLSRRTSIKRKRGAVIESSVKIPSQKAAKGKPRVNPRVANNRVKDEESVIDIEDLGSGLQGGSDGAVAGAAAGPSVQRRHAMEYHSVDRIGAIQEDLLSWFEQVREKRGMPWRKRYDPSLSIEEKGQRAYEIWVSEVMLQQTQVNTVIAYWKRWIEKWPTIADLAKADVEEVNAMWRGLGYYRRARSLLAGAKTVMSHKKFHGRLPVDPAVLEKEVDGVGRYTAGAICSMAYGVRTPIVDGNIHRLLTRLLALHAPQTAPATIKYLWTAAADLVGQLPVDEDREGLAGDWNQALMELGSQVCKPVSPDCAACPMQSACNAYKELSSRPPAPAISKTADCTLCAPIPLSPATDMIPSVQVFPMRKEKKASREEEESVLVLEWRKMGDNGQSGGDRKWLFVKRPEKGLLAGLFEPPTTPIPLAAVASASNKAKTQSYLETSLSALKEYIDLAPQHMVSMCSDARYIGSIPHIFSHINMKYHVTHCVLSNYNGGPPEILQTAPRHAVWLDADGVEQANVGTGVKKVWSEVYGSWGSFEPATGASNAKPKAGKKGGSGGKAKTTGKSTDGNKPKGKKSPAAEGDGTGVMSGAGDGRGKVMRKIMMPAMPVSTKRIKLDS
ncbi:A/G-specific adenine glycosylase [Kwoniella sp. CBS 9459]